MTPPTFPRRNSSRSSSRSPLAALLAALTMLAVLALSPSLLVQQPPRLPRVVAERLTTAAAAAAAFGTCEAAQALPSFDAVMEELNKPPITLNPFSIQPAGQAFFAAYGAYLVWSIVRPPNAAEVEAQGRAAEASAAAAAAAAPFLEAAAEAPGARKTESGLVFEELTAGEGAAPTLEQMVKVHYVGVAWPSPGSAQLTRASKGSEHCALRGRYAVGWHRLRLLARPRRADRVQAEPGHQGVARGYAAAPHPLPPKLLPSSCCTASLPYAGLALMKPGSRAKLTIPAELAYGPMAMASIPANSVLCFDVELLEVKEAGFNFPF